MTIAQALAEEITKHENNGASLFAIGSAIKNAGYHIDTAVVAFEIAGFSAEHKVQTVLGVRVITLTIIDRRKLNELDQSLISLKKTIRDHGFTSEVEEKLQSLVDACTFSTEDKTATIDWTNGHF